MIPDHPNWRMGRLTSEERRRIFLAKEQTSFAPSPSLLEKVLHVPGGGGSSRRR